MMIDSLIYLELYYSLTNENIVIVIIKIKCEGRPPAAKEESLAIISSVFFD